MATRDLSTIMLTHKIDEIQAMVAFMSYGLEQFDELCPDERTNFLRTLKHCVADAQRLVNPSAYEVVQT